MNSSYCIPKKSAAPATTRASTPTKGAKKGAKPFRPPTKGYNILGAFPEQRTLKEVEAPRKIGSGARGNSLTRTQKLRVPPKWAPQCKQE